MDRPIPPALINTFIFAAVLKIIGIFTAMGTAFATSGIFAFDRWGGALISAVILLLIVLPWGRWFGRKIPYTHTQLIIALAVTILFQYGDVLYSSYVPYEPLAVNDRFQLLLGWSLQDVNNVHALGFLFTMVPIILATWHYGVWGMLISLGFNATLYVLLPLALPNDTFNWWFYTVRGFVLLGMTLIVAFVVHTLASAQRRRQAQLSAANGKLAEQAAALAKQAAVMEQLATSRERNRLARELHDTLAHSLSGTAVQLQAVQTLMKFDMAEASAELKTAQAQIKHGLQEARRAIAALRSSPLEELGLANALCNRCDVLSDRMGIPIQCNIQPLPTLPPLTEQTIYRVADEALVNAEKYARANEIWLTLTVVGEQLTLSVKDNGVGFEIEAQENRPNHFGIIGMHERAALINAQLSIESVIGQGTIVQLQISGGAA